MHFYLLCLQTWALRVHRFTGKTPSPWHVLRVTLCSGKVQEALWYFDFKLIAYDTQRRWNSAQHFIPHCIWQQMFIVHANEAVQINLKDINIITRHFRKSRTWPSRRGRSLRSGWSLRMTETGDCRCSYNINNYSVLTLNNLLLIFKLGYLANINTKVNLLLY